MMSLPMSQACLRLSCLLLLAAVAVAGTGTKCTNDELSRFAQEYEQCHDRALEKIQIESRLWKAKEQGQMKKQTSTVVSETQSPPSLPLCNALDSLIEKCTVILGWCYTAEQVQQTKEAQRKLSEDALAKMFPDNLLEGCLQTREEPEGARADPLGTSSAPGKTGHAILTIFTTVALLLNVFIM